MDSIITDMQWRYATKKFDTSKKVSSQDMDHLLEVLRLSPSSFGMQPWKFLVIENPELRAELRTHAWDQAQLTDASHLIVCCASTKLDEDTIEDLLEFYAEERSLPEDILDIYREKLTEFFADYSDQQKTDWAKKQVYLALGFLMSACAHKHIDTCPLEGFNPAAFDDVLNLADQNLTATVLCAIGYRAEGDWNEQLPKARFSKDAVIEVR